MSIKKITISGLRGYSEETTINFAVPDKQNYGSGLNILVGPNNSGKSTLIEAVHMLSVNRDIIPQTARNELTNKKVFIEAVDEIENVMTLSTTENGGAYVERKWNGSKIISGENKLNTYVLNNKRNFSSTFSNNYQQSRDNYNGNAGNDEYRKDNYYNQNFGGRLLEIYNNKRSIFDECLGKVFNPVPEWTIDSINGGEMFLEFSFNGVEHSSQGAGDGYINIFNIIDALYDSEENNVILIDEPEVSLHPDIQKKLLEVLIEYSKDKQIIVSTHSPYFINWNVISDKAKIIRFKKDNNQIKVFEMKDDTKSKIRSFLEDDFNPHTFSLSTNEVFFLSDNVILCEGQEDVVLYRKILKNKYEKVNASFFGWGAGGINKIPDILRILRDLGYSKVFTIIDNDMRDKLEEFKREFSNYEFYAIAADDVRTKPNNFVKNLNKIIDEKQIDRTKHKEIIDIIEQQSILKVGLIKDIKTCEINEVYEEDVKNLILKMKEYFGSNAVSSEETTSNSNIDNEEAKAKKILDNYIKENTPINLIKEEYSYLEFQVYGGGIISFKKVKENIYYAIIEESSKLSDKHEITVDFHYIINTQEKKVVKVSKNVITNTLPKRKL